MNEKYSTHRTAENVKTQLNTTSEDAIIEALALYQWNTPVDFPDIWEMSAHRNHKFHGACALCHGDIEAIVEVIEPIIREREVAASEKWHATATQARQEIVDCRADLDAAQAAGHVETMPHHECNCVPHLGPPHCHACDKGQPVEWVNCPVNAAHTAGIIEGASQVKAVVYSALTRHGELATLAALASVEGGDVK